VKLSDLPQFTTTAVHGEPGSWVLDGVFNQLETVREGRSWLYVSREGSLIGDLDSLDRASRRARFVTPDSVPTSMLGLTLPWLDGWWQAYHVALVLDTTHKWRRVLFQATDAVERRMPGWRELTPAPDEALAGEGVLVSGGWDHEHCMLCNSHIDPANPAYVDDEGNWLCVRCYEAYAEPHDLSFIRSDA
jgi:hypothetical protein